MRVVGVMDFGGPERLQVYDVPRPEPGPGEVRIRIHGAAVNPTDADLRSGVLRAVFASRPPPHVPGMDASGVVSAVGDQVPWSVGEPVVALVMPHWPHGGAYADELVVPAECVVGSPGGIDPIPASTFLMNAMTARMALDGLGLAAGQSLLVTGAAGAFGSFVVELAKADGLVVLADAAPADEELVRSLGADAVMARGEGLGQRVRHALPSGVDAVADGARLQADIVPAIREGGAVAAVHDWSSDPGRGIRICRIRCSERAKDTAALDRLCRQVEDGVVTPRVADVVAPERAADAHRRFERGGVRGRFVIDFRE